MRTLIGGIGTRDSDSDSIGIRVSGRLASDAPIHAAGVVVADVDGDAFDVVERLNGEWPRFERVIFVGAVARARPAGTVTAYKWDRQPPNHELRDAAERDGDAAWFDGALLRLSNMAELPEQVILVEIEPDAESTDSDTEARAVERARTLVRRLATNARAANQLPECSLGEVLPRQQRAD